MFFSPFLLIPEIVGNDDMCGKMCMRRFFLYFPGMSLQDLTSSMAVAWMGVVLLASIFLSTFFYGRLWCAYICPVGGFPELASRSLNDRWKIEYRSLPQVPIRYGYFAVYLVLLPTLGISACTLCNFITLPRIFETLSGELRGFAYVLSSIGLVNIALLLLLGIFASKGRAYCQFLCPIGAMDGIVNRIGAKFRFNRRIRVEASRCTGCNVCARNCMTGAIKMVDRIAVVDQLSCMSCNECVDVCDWHAIDWLALPPDNQPKRIKKGVKFHPLPNWQAIQIIKPKAKGRFTFNVSKIIVTVILISVISFIFVFQLNAATRKTDADGCFTCHALEGLAYIDEHGVYRNATLDKNHYLSSLHGGVPCKDCHRHIKQFPHEVKNGEVDCSASCHLQEPSQGEAYSHKKTSDLFKQSAHGEGASKGFTAGNRLQESKQAQNPSCRLCHSNSLYIDGEKLDEFKSEFSHTETQCGNCHQGQTWLNRLGGHILRRFLEGRKNKQHENKLCINCHGDRKRMKKVELNDKQSTEKHNPDSRFILASDSYAMTLHGRLVESNDENGVSCIDCHSPGKQKHSIYAQTELKSSTQADNLVNTCGSANCHQYSADYINSKFLLTDLHDINYIPINDPEIKSNWLNLDTLWKKILAFLSPFIAILIVGSFISSLFTKNKKSVVFALFGGDHFQQTMIGRKPKVHRKTKHKHRKQVKKRTANK